MTERGVFASGIYDQTNADDSTAVNILEDALGDRFFEYSGSNLLHHKYLIVDPNCPQSDPMVWTGSHNWSTSANSRNDENSIVIHDSTTANIFYQEYMQRYKDEGATEFVEERCEFVSIDEQEVSDHFLLYPNPAKQFIAIKLSPEQDGTIYVYNAQGQLWHSQNIQQADNHTMDISAFPTGTYFCILVTKDDRQTGTFVKVN